MNRFLLILCLNFLLGGVALRQSAHAEGAFDWSLSTDHGGGWKSFDWFGPYWEGNGTDWIYHHELGWLYRQGASTDSIWLWKSHFGWFWMHKDHPSYAYAHEWGNEEVWIEVSPAFLDFFQALQAQSPDSEPPWAKPFTGWVHFDWAGELRSESILYREWNFLFYKDGVWNKDAIDEGRMFLDTLGLPLEVAPTPVDFQDYPSADDVPSEEEIYEEEEDGWDRDRERGRVSDNDDIWEKAGLIDLDDPEPEAMNFVEVVEGAADIFNEYPPTEAPRTKDGG